MCVCLSLSFLSFWLISPWHFFKSPFNVDKQIYNKKSKNMLSSFALRFGHVLRRSKQIYAKVTNISLTFFLKTLLVKNAYYCPKKKNLLVSNTLSTMGLLGLGDMLCQYVDIRLTQRALLSENKKLIRQLQSHLSSEAPQHKPAHTNKQKEQSKHDLEFIKLEKFDWARTG